MESSIILYLIPAALALLGACQYDFSSHQRGRKALWYLIYIYLILFIGLRYKVGGDTLTYMEWYVWAKDITEWTPFSALERLEPGFTFLAAIAKSITDEFYCFQIIHAIIINSCIFYFISKNTRYRFSALLITFITYYLYFSTEVLRESLSVMIFTLNYKSFINRKWLRYYCGVFICILFHLSASFLLLLPFFRNLKFNRYFLLYIIGLIILGIALKPIFSIISVIAPMLGEKATTYGDHGFVGYFWAGLRIIQFSIIPSIILVLSNKSLKIHPKYEISYLFMILSGIGVIFSPIVFQRFTNYFYPLYALSLTDVICSCIISKYLKKRFTSFVLTILITLGYGTYFIYLDAYQMWLPYSSVFKPNEFAFRQKFANGGNG